MNSNKMDSVERLKNAIKKSGEQLEAELVRKKAEEEAKLAGKKTEIEFYDEDDDPEGFWSK